MKNKFSRRDFVKKTAVGVGVVYGSQFAAKVFSAEKGPLLRWGLVGTGQRCRHHIDAIRILPNMDVVATCDVNERRLKKGVERVGQSVRTYSDYRDLLSDPEVDAVLVCTPNLFHKDMVIDALKADKYVMSEKPMAVNIQECREMKAAEEASKQFVLYTLQLRYSYRFGDLKRVIDSGKIGKPQYIFLPEYRGNWFTTDPWMYTDPKTGKKINWRYSHAASGGTLSEKMCHYIDIVNWMVGANPIKIMCNGGINHYQDNRDTWDHASLHLEYEDNTKALLSNCMYYGSHRVGAQIIGELGSLRLMNDHILFESYASRDARPVTEKIPLTKEVGHGTGGATKGVETAILRMYEDFYKCVQNGTRPFVGINEAMSASKVAWLGELSSQKGRTVHWDEL